MSEATMRNTWCWKSIEEVKGVGGWADIATKEKKLHVVMAKNQSRGVIKPLRHQEA